ncbi:MAG: hypothetical protein RLZZ502_233 [Pseudomonadota bacterium]|jgi:farnesyl diphosphate synthase
MNAWISAQQARIEQALLQTFNHCEQHAVRANLLAAMRYAVLGGGKRARALLVYASSALNPDTNNELADAAAVAVELIHAYSLVHDDLPCMDDDDMRRGKPSTHKAYGEATAMLAGDALQTLAFEVLANAPAQPQQVLELIRTLACASGHRGMAGGQALDLSLTGEHFDEQVLQNLHACKTGALISAAVKMGCICAGVERPELSSFAQCLGLAFQVQDDVLDVTSDSGTLGKTAGKDATQNKTTYVSLLGLEGAAHKIQQLNAEASRLVRGDHTQALTIVQAYLLQRKS